MIELKTFGFIEKLTKTALLCDVSLEISEGEFISILGPNGAGKTTFLKCLFGLLDYSGQGQLDGKEIKTYSRKALACKISYIPQIVGTLPNYTVRDFVFMGRHPYLRSVLDAGVKQFAIVDWALTETKCQNLANRMLPTLSGGERQRVLLAAALAQETDIILIDEPGAFLDPPHEELLYSIFHKLNRHQRKTLIVVSHDFNRSALSSGRIIALKNAKLAFDGLSENFMHEKVLEDIYGTRFSFVRHPENDCKMTVPSVC